MEEITVDRMGQCVVAMRLTVPRTGGTSCSPNPLGSWPPSERGYSAMLLLVVLTGVLSIGFDVCR